MTAAPTERRRLPTAYDVAISADSRLLATTSQRTVRLFDLATGRRLASTPLANPSSVDFSPATDRLVVTTTGGEARLYTVPDLTELARFGGEGIGESTEARFEADGRRFLQAGWRGTVVVREGDREILRGRPEGAWSYSRLVRAPDGRLLFVASNQPGAPRAYAVIEAETETLLLRPTETGIAHLAVSPTGLFAGHSGRVLVIWDGEGRELARRDLGPDAFGETLAWAPDGQELVTIEDEVPPQAELLANLTAIIRGTAKESPPKTVQAYTPDLEPTWSLPLPYASSAAYSPDGTALVLGSWERGVILDRG